MTDKELIKALRESAEWAKAHEWEIPITLSEDLTTAADRLEELPTSLPFTIGDKIRSMTDKELTNLLWQISVTDIEDVIPFCKNNDEYDDLDMCKRCLENELKQPCKGWLAGANHEN